MTLRETPAPTFYGVSSQKVANPNEQSSLLTLLVCELARTQQPQTVPSTSKSKRRDTHPTLEHQLGKLSLTQPLNGFWNSTPPLFHIHLVHANAVVKREQFLYMPSKPAEQFGKKREPHPEKRTNRTPQKNMPKSYQKHRPNRNPCR